MDDAHKTREQLLEEIEALRRIVAAPRATSLLPSGGAGAEEHEPVERANVLLVDDHVPNLLTLEAVLAPLGARLVRATSGREALERLLREEFAVILLDVQMPDMDGFDTAALIRTRERTREVPILFVTAIHHDEAYAARGYARGAVDYISKPFNPDVLRAKVAALVDLWRRGENLRRREARVFARERADLRAREQLARGEAEAERARFRTMVMEAPAAISIFAGPEHVYELVNAHAAALIGHRDVVGKPVRVAFPEADAKIVALLDRVYRTGEPFVGQELALTLDWSGTGATATRYFDNTIQPMRDAQGQVTGVFSFAVDVTDKVLARRAVEAERARLRELLMRTPAPIAVFRGPELVYEVSNEANRLFVGDAPVLGRPAREVIPPQLASSFLAWLEQVHRTGEPFAASEVTVHSPERGARVVNLVVQPVHGGAAGDERSVLAFAVDVTEHVQARQRIEDLVIALEGERHALAASEARARRLQDSGVIGVIFWTRAGELTGANDAFLRIVGYSREELEAGLVRWTAMTPPEFAPLDARAFEELDATGVCTPYEKEYLHKDGHRVPILLGVAYWEGSRTEGVAWIVDITERKRAESAFRFLADASTALAGSLDLGTTLAQIARLAVPGLADWASVYLREPGGPIRLEAVTHVDPAMEAVLREIAERYPLPDDAPGGYPRVVRTGASELLAEIGPATRTAVARDAHHLALLEKLGAVSAITVPLRVGGRIFGAVGFVASVSGRRYGAAEQRLAEELGHRIAAALDNARLYETAQRERERAEEASRAKDEFLATLSHELRTPMTAILGWSRMLAAGAVSEERRGKALETIDRNARAQAQLIDDLLDFSRIVSGKLRLNLEPLTLASIVDAAIETVRPAADARGVRLVPEVDTGERVVLGDAARLQQVAWNLLSNAVKFTPRGGRVTVSVRHTDANVELCVSDTGQGIDPGFLPFVFDRFRQADASTTRAHGGLGLGLAIVRHLVELHGGQVEARSDGPGLGATFVVRLPVASARATRSPPPADRTSIVMAAPLECPPELEGLRVLVVDDEPDTREFVAGVLEHCRARVVTVASAAEAYAAVATEPPDVLVSDIGMPGEDGYSLIRRVRALPRDDGGEVPAVALTAFARSEDRMRALSAGFNSHVAKPVDPQELAIVLANLSARLGGRR